MLFMIYKHTRDLFSGLYPGIVEINPHLTIPAVPLHQDHLHIVV